MPKVSIIVPVYNVEKYLRRCLDSILAQTFSDFELILIDDGSTDSSGRICDEYGILDTRVITEHKNNTGVADTRNIGLKIASGDYITFVDSDDYCIPTWLSRFVDIIEKTDCDLILSGFITVDETGSELGVIKRREGCWIINSEAELIDYIIHNVLYRGNGWEVWSSCFKKQIIADNCIEFCTKCHNFAEDMGFMLEYLLCCKTIIAVSSCDYRYVKHFGSMMDISENTVKLDSMNEVALQFGKRFLEKIQLKRNQGRFAIIYYLIMDNQYSKMKLYGEGYKKAVEIDKQITNIEWHDIWMKKVIRHRKELKTIFGKTEAIMAILNSRLVSYRNLKRYRFESYIAWKFLIND